MLSVKFGENRPLTLRNTKISGFAINAYLLSSAVNVQPVNSDVDFSNALLKVILRRDGHIIPIIQNDLKSIGLALNLYSFARRAFYHDAGHAHYLVQGDAATKGQSMLCFDIDLKMTLDLKGTDELYIELSANNGLFSANVDTNSSFIELKPIVSTSVERGVPIITTHVVQGGEMRKTFDLGSNILAVTVLNYDKINAISPVIQSLTIKSNIFSDTFSFRDLINLKYRNLIDTDRAGASFNDESSNEYDQCFELSFPEELDQVGLDITFVPANVVANKNLVIVHSYYTDMKTLAKAQAEEMQKQESKLSTLKQNI